MWSKFRLSPAAVFPIFLLAAFLAALVGDLSVSTRSPMFEFQRMLQGVLNPAWPPAGELLEALLHTVAYAVTAVALAACLGFLLALAYHRWWVRSLCLIVRSVHELFWALLLLQCFGLQPLTGLLAILIPYTGIFARVYADIFEETKALTPAYTPRDSDRLSAFLFGVLSAARSRMATYTLYRLECGLRSSTLLGFIGLPTLGYHLIAAFMEGYYGQVAGLLLLLYAMIAFLRWWLPLNALYLACVPALAWVGWHWQSPGTDVSVLLLSMLPVVEGGISGWFGWVGGIMQTQGWVGVANTLLVAQMAVAVAGVMALAGFAPLSRQFSPAPLRIAWHAVLVILRSTPELIITFALLLLWGPSMLPAVVAIGIHNGAILAHLCGRYSDELQLRPDASRGVNRLFYEVLPRIHGQWLAFLCYRWEVILRETAVLGLLGIPTLGFYIDSAFESFRFDVAVFLIGLSAVINMALEGFSSRLRQSLRLQRYAEIEA